jgi:hypothetical protein
VLLLDSPVESHGLTLYRDHADPATVHYLRGAPRLAGSPGLLVYRGGQGGGLLTVDVHLPVDDGVLDAVRSELAARGGGPANLVPVLFDTGTVRFTVLDGATGVLVERQLGTATPSLLGDCRAIAAVRLDEEGTQLMRSALTSRVLPVVIAYELTFRGLRPASGLRVTVDHAMAYEYLRGQAVVGALWFRADVDREAEALRRAGHVTVEDVDYTGADPQLLAARRDAAARTAVELVDTLFFRPTPGPAALPPPVLMTGGLDAAWRANGCPRTAFVLREHAQNEQQTATYDRTEAAVAAATACPQGALELPAGVDPVITEVDLAEPASPATVALAVPTAADWTGVDALRVDVRGGGQERSVVVTAAEPTGSATLPPGELGVRVTALAAPADDDLGQPPVSEPDYLPVDGRTLLLDPQALAGRRRVELTLGAAAGGVLTAASCDVLVDGVVATTLVLAPRRPSTEVVVWGSPALEVVASLSTVVGDVPVRKPVPDGERAVVFNLPPERFRQLLVTLNDPLARYRSVDVELEQRPGAARAGVALTAASPSAMWTTIREPGTDSFRYRTTTLRTDGLVTRGEWTTAAGSLLVVGDTRLRVAEVTVVLTGWPDLAGALLTLSAADPVAGAGLAEVLLAQGTSSASVRLALRRDAPLRYVIGGEVFTAGGAVAIEPRTETAEVLLLAPV